jgi:uncharacterized protein with von Willebrand factor type A (vWA) domain
MVTPSEAIDAVTVLDLIDLDDRQETFLSLRSVLTSRVEDFPVFEELFQEFWRQRGQRKISERDAPSHSKQYAQLSPSAPKERGLAYFLEHWGETGERAGETIRLPGASDAESISEKDFSLFTDDDLEEISRIARKIVKKLARNASRRWKPVGRGPKVNLRGTIRRSLGAGGELAELSFKQRKQKKTRLVVICDVSGSMDFYSRILLQFIYGLQNSFARVETFVFSTSLERITGLLKRKSYKEALERLAGDVRGWSGGTLIGPSIAAFNSGWSRLVDNRTIVIILSDGWDTADPEVLGASLADLRRRSGKLIWLNPLLGSPDYQPLARGMQAALPHIDVFAPMNNRASLRALERHLDL